ncbi:hypothetical protein D3C72_1633990 [compost metagenome]
MDPRPQVGVAQFQHIEQAKRSQGRQRVLNVAPRFGHRLGRRLGIGAYTRVRQKRAHGALAHRHAVEFTVVHAVRQDVFGLHAWLLMVRHKRYDSGIKLAILRGFGQ